MKLTVKVLLIVSTFCLVMEEASAEQAEKAKESASEDPNDFFKEVSQTREESSNRITVVGTGNVGMAVAYSLITQYVTDDIVLIGKDPKQVEGEVKDLQDGTGFIKSPRISGGTDYALTKNSRICIVTAGVPQKEGQKREELVQMNLEVFKEVIPQLVEHSPNAVILIVTNPVDVMTYIAWKILGKKETYKIIGSGTNLDTSRLRFLISQDLKISSESVHGWVIGEHGDDSVTAWSGVNVAGVNLRVIRQRDKQLSQRMKDGEKETWFELIHKKVVNSAYDIISLKGKTSWAVGLSVSDIAYSILHNAPNIHAVSTLVKGFHEINDEVFMSLPCVLGARGVTRIINQPLEPEELKKIQNVSKKLKKIIDELDWDAKKEEKKPSNPTETPTDSPK